MGIAGLLAVFACVPTLSALGADIGGLPERPMDRLGVALVLAQCAPLVVRSRRPGVCLVIVGAGFGVHQAMSYPLTFASVGLYLALYAAGAHQARYRRGLAVLATAGYVVLVAALHGLGTANRLPEFLAYYAVLVVMWLAGAGMRRRRAEEEERRRAIAAAAASRERARIARELHDVVTHHVTAVVVQADAAQHLLPAAPERVSEGLGVISGTGRQALTELRSLLGVLEATGEGEPASGQIGSLVERARLAGQPVDWAEEGERRVRTHAVELAAYRVVQEALTNALRHAAGQPTTVRLRHHDERLEIEVTTERTSSATATRVAVQPVAPSGGRGLAGLQERLRMLDGDLEATTLPGGGFSVRARIPAVPAARAS